MHNCFLRSLKLLGIRATSAASNPAATGGSYKPGAPNRAPSSMRCAGSAAISGESITKPETTAAALFCKAWRCTRIVIVAQHQAEVRGTVGIGLAEHLVRLHVQRFNHRLKRAGLRVPGQIIDNRFPG